jgi:hypothetical protein
MDRPLDWIGASRGDAGGVERLNTRMRMRELIVAEGSHRPHACLFHGTSEWALEQIRAGGAIKRVYTDSNVSLGGAYLTAQREIARVAAQNASRAHDSSPVILTVRLNHPLLPDEDWVVAASERPLERDFDWHTDTYKDPRYAALFDDLFSEYLGDGHSLSDEYVRKYDLLNRQHQITWKDSFRYIGSVRQAHPISPDQIAGVERL